MKFVLGFLLGIVVASFFWSTAYRDIRSLKLASEQEVVGACVQ